MAQFTEYVMIVNSITVYIQITSINKTKQKEHMFLAYEKETKFM